MARVRVRSSAEPCSMTTIPKLSFCSLPAHRPDPPWIATPPVNLPGSIPFRWEEAPGKPKREQIAPPLPPPSGHRTAAGRRLDLPPRLASKPPAEIRTAEMPSPTTVLDGPNPRTCRTNSYSLSLGEEKAWKIERGGENKERSWRRGSWEMTSVVGTLEGVSSSYSSMSCYYNSIYEGGCGNGCPAEREDEGEEHGMKVKTRRIRRHRSLSVLPSLSTSHWLANVCGIFRQAIPKRRDHKI